MPIFDQSDIARINAADIRAYVPGADGRGRASVYVECPECGKKGKNEGLLVTRKGAKNLAKCFHCDFTLRGPIDAVMYYHQLKFPEAVKYIAEREGIVIESYEQRARRVSSSSFTGAPVPFYLEQLKGSGLTEKDVAIPMEKGVAVSPFRKGTLLPSGREGAGGDMLIHYYDLEGRPQTYSTPRGEEQPYIRVRWRNPDDHLNLEGKPFKYQTPKGAPCRLYIPQKVRERYKTGEPLPWLFVTEGEKKAEKAAKHGVPCVAIQGIFNIGSEQNGLLEDLVTIIDRLKVARTALVLDADYNDLSNNIHGGDKVDARPHLFSKAVIKFRDYLRSLHAKGISTDVYFGYVKPGERGDKGLDDLLVGTLKDREELLLEDVNRTFDTKDGRGLYVDLHKISALSDFAIRDFWYLNRAEDFFAFHKERLAGLEFFRIGNVSYQVVDGRLQASVRCASDGEIWTVDYTDKGEKRINFDYFEALNFISANGFHRYLSEWVASGEYSFIKIEDGIVRHSYETAIRTFVFNYVTSSTKDRDILSKFIKELGRFLSRDVLERLDIADEDFDRIEKFKQRFYYLNGQVTVTPKDITFGAVTDPVWEDRVLSRQFVRRPIFRFIEKGKDGYLLELTDDGRRCEFLRFLINASTFTEKRGAPLTPDEEDERRAHLVNKLTSIGFLLNDYKFQTELKAIIAVDGKMSDVGQSNGRSGKSLVGMALEKMLSQTYIDGRATSNDDQFLYSNVTPRTRNIFFDDALKGFNFEKFFGAITGDLAVNPKNKDRFVIPNSRSPKFYITTNHAIPTRSQSTADRIVFLIYSDYYNLNYSPFDDFGHQLFNDWDDEQWVLFDNLMIEANFYYQKSLWNGWEQSGRGCVLPPMRRIMLRNYRQHMGEDFLAWADSYFAPGGGRLNALYARKLMQEDYQKEVPGFFRPQTFKEKLISFCRFKGYHLNTISPDRDGFKAEYFIQSRPGESFIGESFKSGGSEYFIVESPEHFNEARTKAL